MDTNVIVSAHLNDDGFERYVLDLSLASKIQLFVSAEILAEYESVLRRAKFSFPASDVGESLAQIRKSAKSVEPVRSINVTKDPDDNKFLECADAAGAEFLVTGNLRHFPARYQSVQVVNSRRFLELIAFDLRK